MSGSAKQRAKENKNVPPPLPEPLPSAIFDAHCHLDAMAQRAGLAADDAFVDHALEQARSVNVSKVITVGDTMASSRWCVAAADRHPDVYAAVAVHPTEIQGMSDDDYRELADLAQHPKVVAIGEAGLDYYWDRTTPQEQQLHFRRHIELAQQVDLPLMIHDREAHGDVLRILAEVGSPKQVVFHAFSGDAPIAIECVSRGYILSYPGVITFTNAPLLRAAAAVTPLSQIMVETDSPFLTAAPFRGRPNTPYSVAYTAASLAATVGCQLDAFCKVLRSNGERVFGLSF